MSDDEVEELKNAMVTQHSHDKTGKIDFAHEMVEIASYLNEDARNGRIIADVGNFGQTNEMASIKGDIWSGSDLYANIDSVNIYNRAKNNKYSNFINTFTDYNTSVISKEISRTNEYCANFGDGDIEKGKQNIKNIIESWSPGGEYLTNRLQETTKYSISQIKDAFKLSAYMDSDPGLKYTRDEVNNTIEDINKNATKYDKSIKDKEWDIKYAKYKFYNCLAIPHKEESRYAKK